MAGHMAEWIKKQLSNRYLRAVVISFSVGTLFAGICLGLKFFPLEIRGSLKDIFIYASMAVMLVSYLFCFLAFLILSFHESIYGREVKHDRRLWEGFGREGIVPSEQAYDPYLLDEKYKNPVPGFIIGLLSFIILPILVYCGCIGAYDLSIKQFAVLILIIYGLFSITVFFIRLSRRFRAFRVKINKNIQKEELYVQQNDTDFH